MQTNKSSMNESLLTPYWIKIPSRPNGPLGFGVTAWSLDDALAIIRVRGYTLPDDPREMQIHDNVAYGALHRHVQQHMGPIVVRGIWYPFSQVGV